MQHRDAAVAILAVMVAVMIVGEVMVYYANPYSYDSDVYEVGGGAEYRVESSGASEFRILQIDPGSIGQIERFYVYYDPDYGQVGLSDVGGSVEDLLQDLRSHGVDAVTVDAEALLGVIGTEDPKGSGLIFITGAMPSTVYTGTPGDPILGWTASGGALYWLGPTLGKYVGNPDGSVGEVDWWWDLFYGEGCFNDSEDVIIGDTRSDPVGEALCLSGTGVQFGMSTSVPGSRHIGYVSDSGYGSVGLAEYGSGMVCVLGGYYSDSTRTDLVQVVASNVTYDSETVLDEVVEVRGGSKTGTLEDCQDAVVYIYCGGYFSPYGARYAL